MIEELYKKYYEELINWCHSMTVAHGYIELLKIYM